jgi:hypothetical protein
VKCTLILIGVLSLGCSQEGLIVPPPVADKGEITIFPEELSIYQDYLQTIGEGLRTTRLSYDRGQIEATVISITKSEICPYQEETCSIEPYPNDWGMVRIDKIVDYTPYSEQLTGEPVEQPSGAAASGTSTSGYGGTGAPEPKLSEYEPLHEGQEVSTHFLLTSRPVKVRYIPMKESENGVESAQPPEHEGQLTADQQVESGEKVFQTIPREENYYVFTTRMGDFPGIVEKTLPGLQVGSRFRAEIQYDGRLYVEEYELMEGGREE